MKCIGQDVPFGSGFLHQHSELGIVLLWYLSTLCPQCGARTYDPRSRVACSTASQPGAPALIAFLCCIVLCCPPAPQHTHATTTCLSTLLSMGYFSLGALGKAALIVLKQGYFVDLCFQCHGVTPGSEALGTSGCLDLVLTIMAKPIHDS